MPILNEERHLRRGRQRRVRAGVRRADRGGAGAGSEPGPHRRDRRASWRRRPAGRHWCRNPTGRTADAPQRGDRGEPRPESSCGSTGTACSTRTTCRTAVDELAETGAANVGGLMAAEGTTPFERAVAAAMTSVLGVGAARFHTGRRGRPGRHGLPRRVPPRVAGAGRRLRPAVRAGPGLGDEPPDPRGRRAGLVHPGAARALPAARHASRRWPGSTSSTAGGAGSSPGRTPARSTRATWPPPAAVGRCRRRDGAGRAGHAVGAGAAGRLRRAGRRRLGGDRSGLSPAERARLPLVLATMHMSWGVGFLTSPSSLVPDELRATSEVSGRR